MISQEVNRFEAETLRIGRIGQEAYAHCLHSRNHRLLSWMDWITFSRRLRHQRVYATAVL